MMYGPLAINPNEKVICVYAYDSTDKADAMRVGEQLRKIGVTKPIQTKLMKTHLRENTG